jgi:hypothetical protein
MAGPTTIGARATQQQSIKMQIPERLATVTAYAYIKRTPQQ